MTLLANLIMYFITQALNASKAQTRIEGYERHIKIAPITHKNAIGVVILYTEMGPMADEDRKMMYRAAELCLGAVEVFGHDVERIKAYIDNQVYEMILWPTKTMNKHDGDITYQPLIPLDEDDLQEIGEDPDPAQTGSDEDSGS